MQRGGRLAVTHSQTNIGNIIFLHLAPNNGQVAFCVKVKFRFEHAYSSQLKPFRPTYYSKYGNCDQRRYLSLIFIISLNVGRCLEK